MKRFFTLIFITCASFCIGVSQVAPDFTYTDTDGNTHVLSTALEDGKVILLDFFFVDCPPCITWGPEIKKIAEDFEGTTLEIWALSDRDSDSKILGSIFKPVSSNHFTTGTAGGGPAVINLYAANYNFLGFPTYSLIFPDGSIVWDVWPLTTGAPQIRDYLTEENGVVPLTSAVNDIEELLQTSVYPNPATDVANLKFSLASSTAIKVDIVNVLGQVVSSIPSQDFNAGENNLTLDVKNINEGLYMIRMQSENGIKSFELIVE